MTRSFNWAQAFTTGASHIACGAPCQDAVAVRQVATPAGEPYIVAALADGAGTASHAENGAQYAVECFTNYVGDVLAEFGADDIDEVAQDGARLVHKVLRELAGVRQRQPFAYAATFLGCVSNANLSAFVQIGDGGIVIRDASDRWRLVFQPQHGEYANTSYFITDADALDRLETRIVLKPLSEVVLFSDGLEDLLLRPGSLDVHPPFFEYLRSAFSLAESPGPHDGLSQRLGELLDSPAVRNRSDDDASVVALHFAGDPQ